MEVKEALRLFNLNGDEQQEVIAENIESELFRIKQEAIQKYMVPGLLKNKLTQWKLLAEAEQSLVPDQNYDSGSQHSWTSQPNDKIDFLEQYEQRLSQIKLDVMNAAHHAAFVAAAENLILCQEYFMVLFKLFFSDHYEALPEEVNTREIIDTGQLLVFLKSPETSKDQSWSIEKELARIDKIQSLKRAS